MLILAVGGTWGPDARASSMFEQLVDGLVLGGQSIVHYNGGPLDDLDVLAKQVAVYDAVVWMPNVPNDAPKLLPSLKRDAPRSLLVCSKRMDQRDLGLVDVIDRALTVKANLIVALLRHGDQFGAVLLDPLGNAFAETHDFSRLGQAIAQRLDDLHGVQRVSSRSIGPTREVPDERQFFELIREHADIFDGLVPRTSTRMLGNASFRCQRGFPSFQANGQVFVSRRNVDKRMIDRDAFVAVELDDRGVGYYGDAKPSVDTPVQLKLYRHYRDARYMLHGHVYVRGAEMTNGVIPCGALAEADAVIAAVPDPGAVDFCLNLRGHGFLAVIRDLAAFKPLYAARPSPEPVIQLGDW